jgi:hypothetical protein
VDDKGCLSLPSAGTPYGLPDQVQRVFLRLAGFTARQTTPERIIARHYTGFVPASQKYIYAKPSLKILFLTLPHFWGNAE